ncbi:MAG TPA: hypothetical protein VGG22_16700 [Candidatus Baltobacteraceae bacterium]
MSIAPAALEFGIYRDGDNNLDHEQALVINQALNVSDRDSSIEFVVEDTTSRRGLLHEGALRTESYLIRDGAATDVKVETPHDPSSRENLAAFVARTLDRAQLSGAQQTWIELVDHGGGDGGGLESASHGSMMSERDIAGAIADGTAMHANAHPEDADRKVDGVVANQCLMGTLGFADALSAAGVSRLAASNEIMIAPGVPTTVASAIAQHLEDPQAMAQSIVAATMGARYTIGSEVFAPAASFSVLDTSPEKTAQIRTAVKTLDDDLAAAIERNPELAPHVRADERSVQGMARGEKQTLPWRADRPAIALYDKLASDARLPQKVRDDATAAAASVRSSVLAHRESREFAPYGGVSYSDAVGPTVHAPIRENQIDPWVPQMTETANAFWKAVDAGRLTDALVA